MTDFEGPQGTQVPGHTSADIDIEGDMLAVEQTMLRQRALELAIQHSPGSAGIVSMAEDFLAFLSGSSSTSLADAEKVHELQEKNDWQAKRIQYLETNYQTTLAKLHGTEDLLNRNTNLLNRKSAESNTASYHNGWIAALREADNKVTFGGFDSFLKQQGIRS